MARSLITAVITEDGGRFTNLEQDLSDLASQS